MDATWDFALRGFRTASGLQRARATVRDPYVIKQCRPIVNVARRVQQLALGVNRRWNGSPDRHPKGTPLIDEF